jgi:drug/metabolite transporter (DMT)-like permease
MKQVVLYASPLKGAGLRFFIGALPLLWIALQPERLRGLTRVDFAKFATLGFFQTTLLFGINFYAIQYVPAGVMSIIINTNPFFVAILAHFLIKGDGLTPQKIAGLVIGFSGVLVLVLGGKGLGEVAGYWPLVLLLAAIVWAVSSILVKLFRFKDMLVATAWQSFFGSLPLLLIGFTFESKPIEWNWSFIGWLAYVALPATSFGWWAWNGILQRYSASRISVFLFLIPVCGVISGIVMLGESVSYSLLIGGALVAAGIVLVNMRLNKTRKIL